MTSAASSPRPPRNRALVVVDIAASVILILFAVSVALVVITTAVQLQSLAADNTGALAAVTYGMIVVAVLAAFLGFGFVLVNLVRRRYTFYWPLGAVIIMIAASWIGTALVGGLVA